MGWKKNRICPCYNLALYPPFYILDLSPATFTYPLKFILPFELIQPIPIFRPIKSPVCYVLTTQIPYLP